jgi:hypothetical protein
MVSHSIERRARAPTVRIGGRDELGPYALCTRVSLRSDTPRSSAGTDKVKEGASSIPGHDFRHENGPLDTFKGHDGKYDWRSCVKRNERKR